MVAQKMVTGESTEAPIRGWLPGLTALLAIVSCKGFIVAAAIFPLVRFTAPFNPHLQAAVISLFALLTSVFIFINYRHCHGRYLPVILGAVSAAFVIGTMYIAYSPVVEAVGLAGLIVSAFWSWRANGHEVSSRSGN